MNKMEELCRLVKGKYIQSFSWEREYLLEKDFLRTNVILVLMPTLNYLGEKCLKITFYGVCDLQYYHLESTISDLVINIEDIRNRQWENCQYYVYDVEDMFALKCEDFDYEWITITK